MFINKILIKKNRHYYAIYHFKGDHCADAIVHDFLVMRTLFYILILHKNRGMQSHVVCYVTGRLLGVRFLYRPKQKML